MKSTETLILVWVVMLAMPLAAWGRDGENHRVAICSHPDDQGRKSTHMLTVCGRKVDGHPTTLRSQSSSDCGECEKAHSASPSLCKFTTVTCGPTSEGQSSEAGYDPPVTSIRNK